MATLLAMAIVWEFTLDPIVGLVNKLLHEPLSKLRAPGEDSEDLLRAAELLFALDRPATEVSVSDSEEE